MNVEFHYYMTYLIAAKAGFSSSDAKCLAYSSQYIDNNDHIFNINPGTADHFKNYISQTKNITKPRKKLFRIYPIFHFIPGKVLTLNSRRKDGKLHYLNTTPNNRNANQIFDAALESDNLYQIGLAVHSFADTYAHQNFVGYFESYNHLGGVLQRSPAKIGHASAAHKPDIPNLIWQDKRLCSFNAERNNKEIFLEAAARIFEKLQKYNEPQIVEQTLAEKKEELLADLTAAIGDTTKNYSFIRNLIDQRDKKKRIKNYQELSLKAEYGGRKIEEYDKYKWLEKVLANPLKLFLFKLQRKIPLLPVFIEAAQDKIKDVSGFDLSLSYSWKDLNSYQDSSWFKFQLAVKDLQKKAEIILEKNSFSKMELEKL